jgi:hypothetical protein
MFLQPVFNPMADNKKSFIEVSEIDGIRQVVLGGLSIKVDSVS